MAFIHTWVQQWQIRIRNKETGGIIRFVRENHLPLYYTELEARWWCELNGYELLEIIDLGAKELL